MKPESFKVNDPVIVSATATGTGENILGWIDNIEQFMGRTIVSITYSHQSAIGDRGITVSNLGLITKAPSNYKTGKTSNDHVPTTHH